jgi:hypothetical protein
VGSRPAGPRSEPPLVRGVSRDCRWLLAGSFLLLASCATGRLADLPDHQAQARPVSNPSDEQAHQQTVDTLRDAFLERGEVAAKHQPIAPTFVSSSTRLEVVRAMLSMSDMGRRPYRMDQVYARLEPSFRTSVDRLRAVGTGGDVEMRELLKEVAQGLGACAVPIAQFLSELRYDGGPVIIVAPVKGQRRIVEKTLTRYLGDVSLVQDIVRGSVVVDHPDDVRVIADKTLTILRQRNVEIVEVEDHFADTGGGYRDFQINFRLPRTRVIGELQVHLKDLLVIKQRVGHGVYERARLACAAMEMGITNADVSGVCARNAEEMASSYDRAYRRSLTRPRIRVLPCKPVRSAVPTALVPSGTTAFIRNAAPSSDRLPSRGVRGPARPATPAAPTSPPIAASPSW